MSDRARKPIPDATPNAQPLRRPLGAPHRELAGESAPLDSRFGGVGREVPHRAAMESAFGEDFSGVPTFTGQRSVLEPLGARAAAAGETIAFADRRPSKHLVAHELAHVVQRRRHRALQRSQIAPPDSAAEREAEQAAFAASRGAFAAVAAIPIGRIALSPANPFDDPKAWSSREEAAKALAAYKKLPPAARKAAVAASSKTKVSAVSMVLAMLSRKDQVQTFVNEIREITRWIEENETRASSGMTDEEIATEEGQFLKQQAEDEAKKKAEAEAKKKGVKAKAPTAAELEAARKQKVADTSIGSATTNWWGALSGAEKAAWTKRGSDAIANVIAYAKTHHPELGITAAHFKLDFPGVEKRGAGVVAAGSPAQVGKDFVEAVELDPAYVMDIVVHEIFGHPEYGKYGTEYHLELYDKAAAKIPGYVKPAPGSEERRKEVDAYAYQETEIYAVLRSMPYRTPPKKEHVGKVPNLDTQQLVNAHVRSMKKQWSTKLIEPILRGFRKRLVADPRITAEALAAFDAAVETNFDEAMQQAVAK